jgi:chromosome segregation ATPase
MDRPVTGRPSTTTTGLEMPKTSRGKSAALRRQIQDKSYWIATLKGKMSELASEINNIMQENERMSDDEARMSSFKKKAEMLTKELTGLTLELSTYNEFQDRQRIGDSVEDVKEDLETVRSENEDLQTRIEEGFEERKKQENILNSMEKQLSKKNTDLERLLHGLSHEDQKVYSFLQDESLKLTNRVKQLEDQMKKLTERRKEQEASLASGSHPTLRREILQALDHLNGLEKQKNDLTHGPSNRDEKTTLLAQVKRDNKEIAEMETRIRDINVSLEEVKSELEGYEDQESIDKCRDLKNKEKTMDVFLKEFEDEKQSALDKLIEIGSEIRSILDKTTRMINYIDVLKSTQYSSRGSGKGVERLLNEKRKMELDLNKIEEMRVKVQSETEQLGVKINQLEEDIKIYSDVNKLKEDIESKSGSLTELRESLLSDVKKTKIVCDQLNQSLLTKKQTLEANEFYQRLKDLEKKLTQVLAVNESLETSIYESDHTVIKQRVLNQAKKYNQRLQGF